ncbi:hypothetical protein C8J57DRAFT_1252822 [Mycena rebaudengoi]|nr:hypothetical protein C8J57DRAFT_1252822 [Mycena rebaudengoi]
MKWENPGPSLRFRKLDNQLVPKELPALNEPASSLTSVDGGTYMFLFGGHDPKSKNSFIWWYVEIPGPSASRMSAGMVAIRNRPLPFALPLLGYSIRATPMDDGAEILLTRGLLLYLRTLVSSSTPKTITSGRQTGLRWCMKPGIALAQRRAGIIRYVAYLLAWLTLLRIGEVIKPQFENIDKIVGEPQNAGPSATSGHRVIGTRRNLFCRKYEILEFCEPRTEHWALSLPGFVCPKVHAGALYNVKLVPPLVDIIVALGKE